MYFNSLKNFFIDINIDIVIFSKKASAGACNSLNINEIKGKLIVSKACNCDDFML
jgi:hypothetical protein